MTTNQGEPLINSWIGIKVSIKNPFEVPVTLHNIVLRSPIKFIEQPGDENPTPDNPIDLPAGSDTIAEYKIKRPRGYFSPVSKFDLDAEVVYAIASEQGAHRNTASMQLVLRPKGWSLLCGALIGAFLGVALSILRHGNVQEVIDKSIEGFTWQRGIGALLGVIAAWLLATFVIFLANRTTGVVTVEDFIGAALIGVAVVFGTVELGGISDSILSDITDNQEAGDDATNEPQASPAATIEP